MTELSTDRRFHSLTQEQVQTLDQVLTEVIPIHGRGNFPTLEVKPKDIIHMVRDKLREKEIKVRDVRLNGSTASHVLVKENGTSYKDLDIIFGVELPKQEDFQIIKEVVLRCLLDFLPSGVNKEKITALTMKEAYVQKMVKVFTEHDRWSLISLSNNSGKNVELKFVNSLRRQFEFSVDSFQIILDRMLESYLQAERRQGLRRERPEEKASAQGQSTSQPQVAPAEVPSSSLELDKPQSQDEDLPGSPEVTTGSSDSPCKEVEMREEEPSCLTEEPVTETVDMEEMKEMEEVTETSTTAPALEPEAWEEMEQEVKPTEAGGEETASIVEKEEETSKGDFEAPTQDEMSLEVKTSMNAVTAVHVENSVNIETTDMNTDSMPPLEKTTNEGQVSLKVLCVSPYQSCACHSLDTQDTEYPLPPPAKKIYKNSQMVVLKHSSPKPPRKMSKKVTNVVPPPLKTISPEEPSVISQRLENAKTASDESVPMVVEVSGSNTNHSESPASTPQQEDRQDKLLNIQTTTDTVELPGSSTDSQTQASSLQRLSCESPSPSLEVTDQSAEAEVPRLSDKDQCSQIPTVEILPPSPQALEPAVKIAEPADQVSELTSLVPESMAQEPDNITKFPESTAQVLETAAQAPGPIDPVAEASCQGPELPELPAPELASQAQTISTPEPDAQPQESDVQVPQPDVHLLESDFQAPEADIQVQESGIQVAEPDVDELKSDNQVTQPDVHLRESGVQVSEPDVQILETDIQVPEATEECEKLQEEAASHDEEKEATSPSIDLPSITVVAESMYGDFEQAMDHLRYRLIATRNPEEIRGGGLLKYSNLLVREFKPASETEIKTLERYMCSRFFIDFPDVNEQQRKIESYLRNHFIGEEKSKYDYLMTLRRVVNESTVCLMGHERRQTLNMITVLALKVLGEQNIIPNTTNVTCYYQPAPYMTDHSFNNYYIAHGQPPLFYQPYPLHIHMQTGLV